MSKSVPIFGLLVCIACTIKAQDAHKITYDEAISIALGESYTVHYYKEDMDATRYS